jgi:ferrous iron transport protein A
MPLSMIGLGNSSSVVKISGKDDVRRFLENLGFVNGSEVTIVSEYGGDLIIKVRDTRVAISRSMANKIQVA